MDDTKEKNHLDESTERSRDAFPLRAVYNVPLDVNIVLGHKKMSISQVLELKPNAIIELDRKENEPVEIHINSKCVAYGEIILVGNKIGVTIMSIVDPTISG